ncbi:putative nucleotidyltransferase substrate binding domain-containing protein [Emcibacter nanhaiensis]|uniref:Cyclic nucleotide-binding/CBS domain-containing protein n=1 Tax=Emcibacter nanhaiensis TaxID=1505037 RepID=A0A501PFH5_9PROT|nr:putative nucleotidyltransferase substrate binding domain-containing protein [Emcibacter nanhaiensis]TPD58935.1 cyclic nucleotide-binding/CBS domain-containing protein [Emcibacter nanhaiensis]
MTAELADIINFLAEHHPFREMPEDLLPAVARKISISYARRGSTILTPGQKNTSLYMIRKGAVELHEGGINFTARLGEGSFFGYPSLFRDGIIRNGVTAIEDSLIYALPEEEFKSLLAKYKAFMTFFATNETDRLRHALEDAKRRGLQGQLTDGEIQFLGLKLKDLIRKEPVTVSPDTSIQQATQVMTARKVSTVLVIEEGKLSGIFTDKDLRRRVVATGHDISDRVQNVMTSAPQTLSPDTPAIQALLAMMQHHFHHVPVVEESGKVRGLVSASDILNRLSSNAVYNAARIEKAEDVAAVIETVKSVPDIVLSLMKTGVSADMTGHVVSSIGEAAHRKLLELAEKELGPPPVPYALLAFGSLARCDQTALSDQDNGFVLSDDYVEEEHGDYFKKLAERMCADLDAAGYVFCGGNIMASNDDLRIPLSDWKKTFDRWFSEPEPKAVMHATIFFDLRGIYGDMSLVEQLRAHITEQAPKSRIFLAHLTENARQSHVPLGFFRRFTLMRNKEHADQFDIKKQGVVPIQDVTRTHALAHGIEEVNVLERLARLKEKKVLMPEDADNLRDAYEFIAEVRFRHQARQIKRGDKADNYVNPEELSALEREHLRDAFEIVRRAQDRLSRDYGGGVY